MTKKDIKIFFKAVSTGNYEQVLSLLQGNPEYIGVCNVAPPKKDDGQSGLQVAFKTGNFEIARLLIDKGSDLNFMETSDINEWNAPVLHDCITATIFNTYTLQKNTEKFDLAFLLLKLMLDKKADPNARDSYGNNCLHRAVLDARQMIDNPGANITNGVLIDQLKRVFRELIKAGADAKKCSNGGDSAEALYRNFRLDKYNLM